MTISREPDAAMDFLPAAGKFQGVLRPGIVLLDACLLQRHGGKALEVRQSLEMFGCGTAALPGDV